MWINKLTQKGHVRDNQLRSTTTAFYKLTQKGHVRDNQLRSTTTASTRYDHCVVAQITTVLCIKQWANAGNYCFLILACEVRLKTSDT